MKRERGLCELYADDPEAADAVVWGRRAHPSTRRGFLRGMGLSSLGLALGAAIPFQRHYPAGVIPAAFAEGGRPGDLVTTKDGLRVLNDRPLNAETPPWLLDDAFTPVNRHFVRNNGLVPAMAKKGDAAAWTLTVDGEVERPLTLSLADLQKHEKVSRAQVIECGGNGRASFNPPAKGNQWTIGAVGCSVYGGVRLADVLKAAGIKPSAVFVAYEGLDTHLSGDPKKRPISRGLPLKKALDPETLLVWEMNGAPLPALHGFPVRMLGPGWPGSVSGKWLRRLWVRDQVHDGPKMTGTSYRVPARPVKPGTDVPDSDMKIIERMPVKSVITRPRSGVSLGASEALAVRGHAWSGERSIAAVDVTVDFGQTWIPAQVQPPRNPHAWQRWTAEVRFPTPGYYELWARATDSAGAMQPMLVPGWNPKGYLNNAMHRIAVTVS